MAIGKYIKYKHKCRLYFFYSRINKVLYKLYMKNADRMDVVILDIETLYGELIDDTEASRV